MYWRGRRGIWRDLECLHAIEWREVMLEARWRWPRDGQSQLQSQSLGKDEGDLGYKSRGRAPPNVWRGRVIGARVHFSATGTAAALQFADAGGGRAGDFLDRVEAANTTVKQLGRRPNGRHFRAVPQWRHSV
jgi:hypothetical protein